MNKKKIIHCGYVFYETPFEILERDISEKFLDTYSKKKEKTLGELIRTKGACKAEAKKTVLELKEYSRFLDKEVTVFMRYLYNKGDRFYLELLNKHGCEKFCTFRLTDEQIYRQRGLYLYTLDGEIMYVGRCLDNFASRFNSNYGSILSINCYKGGRSTNTHINSLVNRYGDNIKIYLCILSDEKKIIEAEKLLLEDKDQRPDWNRRK